MSEEINTVIGDIPVGQWDYKTLFPQLKRCRAILLETLRLYPPIMALPKWTSEKAQTLSVGEQTLVIPPGISTIPSSWPFRRIPGYWHDPRTWQPSRWIVSPAPDNSPSARNSSAEEVLEPEREHLLPVVRRSTRIARGRSSPKWRPSQSWPVYLGAIACLSRKTQERAMRLPRRGSWIALMTLIWRCCCG